jgi:hypothetical protein
MAEIWSGRVNAAGSSAEHGSTAEDDEDFTLSSIRQVTEKTQHPSSSLDSQAHRS